MGAVFAGDGGAVDNGEMVVVVMVEDGG